MKLESIEGVVCALNDAGVPFSAVGGLAVVANGYGPHTPGIDPVIRTEPDAIRNAFRPLGSRGYQSRVPVTAVGFADPRQRARWMPEKGMRALKSHTDRQRETPVDVFVAEPFGRPRDLADIAELRLLHGDRPDA